MVQKHEITVFPKQGDFIDCEAPFPAFVGGIGSGKTEGGAIKALKYMSEHPNSLGMVTTPTFPMMRDVTLRTIQDIFPVGSYKFYPSEMRIEMTNGAEALLRSTDDPERLRGPNLAWFWMDEAAQSKGGSFKILQGRIRQPGFPHQGWITTTPRGFNWVYMEFAKDKRDDYPLFPCSARENPYLPPGYIRMLEESYKGEFALQEIEGQFTVIGGTMFFDLDSLRDLMQNYTAEPRETRLGGLVKIWKKPVMNGQYIAFGDVAWGEKGAYSCVTYADYRTMEQVAEIYGRPNFDELATVTVELGREYNNAYTGIEANGEGINLINLMVDVDYGQYMYHHGKDWKREVKDCGWLTTGGVGGTRRIMLAALEMGLRNRQLPVRCSEAVDEMMSFVRADDGVPGPVEGAYSDHVMSWAGLTQMAQYARFYSTNIQPVSTGRAF